jgi:chorismate mutase
MLRNKIDEVDEQILLLLGERVRICKTIGSEKKKCGLPVTDYSREKDVYEHVYQYAAKLELNPMLVEAVYREIVNMCSSVQE